MARIQRTLAASAEDSPAVIGADAARLGLLWGAVQARLGEDGVRRTAARGASLARSEVVEYALGHALPAAVEAESRSGSS